MYRRTSIISNEGHELSCVLSNDRRALWGAFLLGHHVYSIRAWQYLAFDMPGGDNVWDSVPLALDELKLPISVLAKLLSSAETTLFEQRSEDLRRINDEGEANSPDVFFRTWPGERRLRDAPGRQTWELLVELAERMVPPSHGAYRMFEFGKAIGKCHVVLNQESDLEATNPYAADIVRHAQSLTRSGLFEIPLFHRLNAINIGGNARRVRFRMVRASTGRRNGRYCFGDGLLEALFTLYCTTEQALREGVGVARQLQHDYKNQERDRWIYDQVQANGGEIKYSTILRKLADKAPTKGWVTIGTIGGLKRAARDYAVRFMREPLIKRKQGRPQSIH